MKTAKTDKWAIATKDILSIQALHTDSKDSSIVKFSSSLQASNQLFASGPLGALRSACSPHISGDVVYGQH